MKVASKEFVIKKMTELMITPKKHYSQNFLVDYDIVKNAIDELDVKDDEIVIEIGPGLGALTQELLQRNIEVYAFEIDKDMVNHLSSFFKNYANFHLSQEDFLKVDLSIFKDKKIKFISNVPYNITTPLIEKIVTSSLNIVSFEFMVQKEVYDRLKAKVGTKEYAPINVFIEYVGKLKVVQKVSYKCFIPMPNVDSIILKIDFVNEITKDKALNKEFVRITKASFALRRKTMLNNLTGYFNDKEKARIILKEVGIEESTRPEQINTETFFKLGKYVYQNK
ncbi:MAG: 16S rRNA (adenine(1518)-N(6)/adenine(1519)-N(6))-dimethyltransferase RsmA [Bacillales bacterium]|nr:16S rRNA (adenine(1518)-N(6)/adenine(1519)-N(6))-dimethyltransferase RsmA [Bacillales bacterium]